MSTKIIKELHPLEGKIILAFKGQKKLNLEDLSKITKLPESQIRRSIQWLITKNVLKIAKRETVQSASLTELGSKYAQKGLPEARLLKKLQDKKEVKIGKTGLEPQELSGAIGCLKEHDIIEIKDGCIKFKSPKNVDQVLKVQECIAKFEDQAIYIDNLCEEERLIVQSMSRKRGKSKGVFQIKEGETFVYEITKIGETVLKSLSKGKIVAEISQLTPELIKDSKWQGKKFREYNIQLKPPRTVIGRKHPYQEFLNGVRSKLLAMGFHEVEGSIVETELWNMDALYMPQFHPAREIHGIYFVRRPQYGREKETKVMERIAKTHENGWRTGSKGWGYKFDSKRATRLILRSHGTVLSVRALAKYPDPPGKYFTITRCFRPDAVDATHAPDFYQIDGIVVGKQINLGSLLGLLKMFGREIAQAKEIKFTPGYFPFTEPSVELHGKHPKMGWVEFGGAGIFRPEVTLPLGVKVPVIAWGLGLDRMAMVAMGIQDIRELFTADLERLRNIKTI